MAFTVPRLSPTGALLLGDQKAPMEPGQLCRVCHETDPARYQNCTRGDCAPMGVPAYKDAESPFTQPGDYVSAFSLARKMRAKALSLDWDEDEKRDKLLLRARELEKGDRAEVPNEDF